MNTPLISIIIPVYNAGNHIIRCLNSIINQTYSNIEVIIIDDGSSDLSGSICDSYARKYDYIQIIHKKNEGVSIARQIGIKHSKGVYSIHVDADDYIDKYEIEKMVNKALKYNADIVVCDYLFEYKKNKFAYKKGMKDSCTAIDFLKQIYDGVFIGTLWNKLIKTSLYNNIIFPKRCNYCEDVYILTQILSKDITINYINEALYHYCYNASSLTRKTDKNHLINRITFIQEIEKIIPKKIDVSHLKIAVKLFALKSGKYTYQEYVNLYPTTIFRKHLFNKKDALFLSIAKFHIGYQCLKIIFKLRNIF